MKNNIWLYLFVISLYHNNQYILRHQINIIPLSSKKKGGQWLNIEISLFANALCIYPSQNPVVGL
jgi:hypothetical protein